MITIIHGEDIVSSRRFFIDERKKSLHPITFSGDNLNLTDIAQAVEGNSLFDIVNKEIFIEDLFSKKQSQEFSGIVSYLQKHSRNVNIKIWESKELSKTQISLFKNANIKHFFLPKALFAFLNELKPNNSKKMIGFFHKTLESLECELIFFMIIRQFRLFLAIQEKPLENQIDEIKRMAPWQKSRLGSQAKLFSKDELKEIFGKVLEIEISQKSGTNILSLPQAIDFLLLSI